MVDLSAMWIHQRTGRNTAISAPLWAVVLGLLTVVGLISEAIRAAWNPTVLEPLAVTVALAGLAWFRSRALTRGQRARVEADRRRRAAAQSAEAARDRQAKYQD